MNILQLKKTQEWVATPRLKKMTFILTVKVTPNASKNQIVGWEEDYLRVRIRGVPEKGQVNKELIAFIAEQLDIAKSQVELISGHTSRIKRLKIEGARVKRGQIIRGEL